MAPKDIEELKTLSRKELQALAKENGLKANLSNVALIEGLVPILFPALEAVVAEVTVAPDSVAVNEPEAEIIDDSAFSPGVGVEVQVLIDGNWLNGSIKRVNKTSYRVILSDNSETTVKFDAIRKPSIKIVEEVAEEAAVEQVIEAEVVPDVEGEFNEIDPSEEATALSCIEDSLQEYSFHVQDNDDLEDDQELPTEENNFVFDNDEEGIQEMDVEEDQSEASEDTETVAEEETEEAAATAPEVGTATSAAPSVAFDASTVIGKVKKTAFVSAAASSNPFSKLTAKTPTKAPNGATAAVTSKVTFNSGHKTAKALMHSHRSSIAVSSGVLHHSASKTPRPSRQTIHGKAIHASAAASTAPAAAVTKTPTAPRVVTHTPAFAVKMTKAQQMRNEAVSHKLTAQSSEETSQFQFKTAGSTSALAATNAIKPTIGASSSSTSSSVIVAKTPATAAPAVKSRPGSVAPSSAAVVVAGSTKRKLNQAFGITATAAGTNITSHIDASAASAATPSVAATATTPAVKKTFGPDFSKIHSAQFSQSKSISSMVVKNKAIGIKMTNAFEAEMNGTAPTFNVGTTAPTPATTAGTSSKAKQPFSRSVSTSRARPTGAGATASQSTSHRSSSVTVTSSRVSAIAAVTPSVPSAASAAAPSSVSFAKTPIKPSGRSSITTGDKENLVGSVNKKFVTARRASHFAGKAKGDLRDIRRSSYMDSASDKRQQSATKARTASLLDSVTADSNECVSSSSAAVEMESADLIIQSGAQLQTLVQSMSPGPFSAVKSPLEF